MSEAAKDSLLGNKIAAGLLTAGLVFWGANRIANILVPDENPKIPAIKIAGLQSAAPAAAAQGLASIIPLIAAADVAKGSAFVQQQCSSCHTLSPGGAAGVGPNLYGVMGSPMFAGSFSYSDAAKAKAKGNWNYDNMNAWLADPQGFAPGTAMSYPGIKNTQTRADAVAYLRSLAGSPIPLPSPAEVKAASTPAVASAAASGPAGAPPGTGPTPPSINTLFASADAAKGQAVVEQQCSACHTLNKGGAAGVGPNLYGIVGAPMFSQSGFSYSSAVKAKAGTSWSPAVLADWLANPQGFAPGTAMSFGGIKNPQTLADVITYLNKNSDKPVKLPGT